ncbi:uncharacterized protein LTR77_005723 [Saxophila tyrrhenica]|uniref:Uncharacterized protein n=1 Tax=Saxophila tyrrhenica TaxID=1690608 RepID=A0AAV9PDG0_9PEZI|nr:hypothetical protein LTR77_005723 [Saxophila tyrrhenica]
MASLVRIAGVGLVIVTSTTAAPVPPIFSLIPAPLVPGPTNPTGLAKCMRTYGAPHCIELWERPNFKPQGSGQDTAAQGATKNEGAAPSSELEARAPQPPPDEDWEDVVGKICLEHPWIPGFCDDHQPEPTDEGLVPTSELEPRAVLAEPPFKGHDDALAKICYHNPIPDLCDDIVTKSPRRSTVETRDNIFHKLLKIGWDDAVTATVSDHPGEVLEDAMNEPEPRSLPDSPPHHVKPLGSGPDAAPREAYNNAENLLPPTAKREAAQIDGPLDGPYEYGPWTDETYREPTWLRPVLGWKCDVGATVDVPLFCT